MQTGHAFLDNKKQLLQVQTMVPLLVFSIFFVATVSFFQGFAALAHAHTHYSQKTNRTQCMQLEQLLQVYLLK